ncbi:hypothetical protein IAR50_003106 [Cryptococcus sp. DSM 104548]
MPPRKRKSTSKPPGRVSKRLSITKHHQDAPSSALPSFFTRLPPEIGAMIYDQIRLTASPSDLINLCCTSETTYLTFICLLYESVRLNSRNVRAFFGDLCNGQPASILCPRPEVDTEVLRKCLPQVSPRLLRKFVTFNPYIQLVSLGFSSPTPKELKSTSSVLKKILLCRFIKKITIDDLTVCHFFRHFADIVYKRFRRFPFYEPEDSSGSPAEFSFRHVEWLVFSQRFTEDVANQWSIGEAASRNEKWCWVELTVRHVAPRRLCAWALTDDRVHMASMLGVGGQMTHMPQLKQFVLHNAHFCTELFPLPADHIEYYLAPEKAGCSHEQSISNGLPYMFAVPRTDRHHDIHGTRRIDIHGANITRRQVTDILDRSHAAAAKSWKKWEGTLVVDGKQIPMKNCEGCGLAG